MNYPTNWLMRARRKYLRECARDYPHEAKERTDKKPLSESDRSENPDDGPDEFSPDAIFGEN